MTQEGRSHPKEHPFGKEALQNAPSKRGENLKKKRRSTSSDASDGPGISLVLLAGGQGSRMKSSIPKQFLKMGRKPLVLYSLELFFSLPEISEIVVVAPKEYHETFSSYHVKLALPGQRRQDSLFNGLQQVSSKNDFVCIHDAARPLVTRASVKKLIDAGIQIGAATLAVPVKPTIKEATSEGLVKRTLDRNKLWEIQTPQILCKKLLFEGFLKALHDQITVTDDVTFAELLSHPVKLVLGEYSNLKVTTPEDLVIAENFLGACIDTR